MSFFSRKDPTLPPPDLAKKDEKGASSKGKSYNPRDLLLRLDKLEAKGALGGKERKHFGDDGLIAGAAKLPIRIRTMDGKTYKIEAKTDWDVQRLKQEFERWHGGNAAMWSLYYKAKKLQDNNPLQSYKIGAGDFVMANYRSVGGLQV